MVLLLIAANLICSFPAVVPVFLLINRSSGGTPAADRLLADKLDLNWFTDVFNRQLPWASLEATAVQVAVLLFVMGLSYLLLNTLFAGGILGAFASEGGHFTMRKFWSDCGAYFWRFFRLTLISLLFYLALLIVYLLLRWWLAQAAKQATAEGPVLYRQWAVISVLAIFFALINMIFDYARISTIVNGGRRMFRETAHALRFSLRRLFGAFGLYLSITIVGTTLFTCLVWLRNSIDQSSIIAVLMALIIGQLAVASRIWMRLTFYAAELNYYRRHSPSPAPMVIPAADDEIDFLDLPETDGVEREDRPADRGSEPSRSIHAGTAPGRADEARDVEEVKSVEVKSIEEERKRDL
jgi:hypothetical protein